MSRVKALLAGTAIAMTALSAPALAQDASNEDARPDFTVQTPDAEQNFPTVGPLQDKTLDEIAELQARIQKLQLELQAAKLEEQIERIRGSASSDTDARASTGDDSTESEPEPTADASGDDDENPLGPNDRFGTPVPDQAPPAPYQSGASRPDFSAPPAGMQGGPGGPAMMPSAPAQQAAPQPAPEKPEVLAISGVKNAYRARLALPNGSSRVVRAGEEISDTWEVVDVTRDSVKVRHDDGDPVILEMRRPGASPEAGGDAPPPAPPADNGYGAPADGGAFPPPPPYDGDQDSPEMYEGFGESFDDGDVPLDQSSSGGGFSDPVVVDGFDN